MTQTDRDEEQRSKNIRSTDQSVREGERQRDRDGYTRGTKNLVMHFVFVFAKLLSEQLRKNEIVMPISGSV